MKNIEKIKAANLKQSKEKYNYKGALEPVKIKVVVFYGMPDFIFSLEGWNQEGGWKGLIKQGAFCLRDVLYVFTGTMNPVDFDNLDAWEG